MKSTIILIGIVIVVSLIYIYINYMNNNKNDFNKPKLELMENDATYLSNFDNLKQDISIITFKLNRIEALVHKFLPELVKKPVQQNENNKNKLELIIDDENEDLANDPPPKKETKKNEDVISEKDLVKIDEGFVDKDNEEDEYLDGMEEVSEEISKTTKKSTKNKTKKNTVT